MMTSIVYPQWLLSHICKHTYIMTFIHEKRQTTYKQKTDRSQTDEIN